MVMQFKDDDDGYLRWVHSNPNGFVVNVDEPNRAPRYPMVHRATHQIISSPARANYTTARYFKVCGHDLEALDRWSLANYGKRLHPCATCM